MNLRRNLVVLAALLLALTACGKKEEPVKKVEAPPAPATPAPAPMAGVTVTAINLGSAVGADKKVTKGTDTFGTKDTIYASVDTTGSGTATLKAKWTFRRDGKEAIVKEDTMTIAPTGAATNEFHISKPDGWPVGNYQVEIFVADKSVGTKAFTVK